MIATMTRKNPLKSLFLIVMMLGLAFAQDTSANSSKTLPETSHLTINEVGIGFGYPTYQLYHLSYAFQSDVFGVAFKGSYTGEGLFLSLAGRYYTPLPVPVPTFVSVGAGIAGSNPTLAATFGLHAPLGIDSNFRATLEAGVAYIGSTGIRPVATLGLGYVFYVDTAPLSPEERRQRDLARLRELNCTEPTEPNPDQLEAAFDKAIEDFLAKARAQYAGTYSDLNYEVTIEEQTIKDFEATITADVSGSVRVIATGKRESARGKIIAYFGWNGCSWSLLKYDTEF